MANQSSAVVAAVEVTPKPLTAEERIKFLEARNAELEAKVASKAPGKITLRVSAKGAVSAYGLGRWPVTLYRSQWEALLTQVEQIRAFIAANADKLASRE
jgi:hypothetical protein